ncbi:hypothetical protein ACFVYD_00710 [Streptomyces sp. NPDC058301]|uniref:hypothetical protein n=1 Tax=Streptomyces sp. NPDC058301 TaxID=3346436 RepID=UPI0036E36E48
MYPRVELFGSTPSLVNASDNVPEAPAAAASRSRVYGLVPMKIPSAPGHAFAASYGLTTR